MTLTAAYLGAIVGFALGVHLQGTVFGQTSNAGYHAADGKLMSKGDATVDKAKFLLITSAIGYVSGPILVEFLKTNSIITLVLIGTMIIIGLDEDSGW